MIRLLLSVSFILACAAPAMAQDHYSGPDIAAEISGKTLWAEHLPDRYYFGEDGTFLLQYAMARQDYAAGAVRAGVWAMEDGALCWRFSGAPDKECYRVRKEDSALRPWGVYDDLYQVSGVEGARSLYWDRWMHGNLILQPDIWRALAGGEVAGFETEAYRAAITGKIMRLPLGHVYHHKNGTAYWLDQAAVDAVRQAAAALDDEAFVKGQSISASRWTLEGNRHCWVYEGDSKICNIVVDAANGYYPQAGYFQIMDDQFIRLIRPEDLSAGD